MSSRRRNGNAIRGPQSALTDFLAAHNISAAQIRQEYEQRRRNADQQGQVDHDTVANGAGDDREPVSVKEEGEVEERSEIEQQTKKRKRKQEAAIAKIKKTKEFKKRKLQLMGEPGDDDDEELALDMYAKSKPLPGQLENCELCEKRFTVTPYSKTGPDGGLLCTKCGKAQEEEKKKEAKAKQATMNRERRRKVQSNLLDGLATRGSKSLLELCVEKVADSINDIEEFGDLPPVLLDRLSQILSKRRVLTPRTLDLFLRPDVDTVAVYDCARLETDDFIKIFSIIPKVQKIDLRFAGQIKDSVIDYILERKVPLREIRLDAANLVSNDKWREFFDKAGSDLESLELSWLDFAMDDKTAQHLADNCYHLKRLKMKRCFHLGDESLEHFSRLQTLEHLSLTPMAPTSVDCLTALIFSVGANLQTLSLRRFQDADDQLLVAIHMTCQKLTKLAVTDSDRMSDAAYAALFSGWLNPPLSLVSFSSNRDIDNGEPDGPESAIGLASEGFRALMNHSGSRLERLKINSCRHISREALEEVFDGEKQYPMLRDIDVSFVSQVNSFVISRIFKSCPAVKKVAAFGCFDIIDVVVPPGLALIGVPTAQDSIVQEGSPDAVVP